MDSTQEEKKLQDIIVRFTLITSKYARSGKDTLADLLYHRYKQIRYNSPDYITFNRFRFAQPLIKAFELIFGHRWDVDKLNPQVRTKLIKFSDACKTVDYYLWINKTLDEVEASLKEDFEELNIIKNSRLNYIFTDCRYNYEYEKLSELLLNIASTYNVKTEIKLVEVVTTGTGAVTDRDNVAEAITVVPDFKIWNSKDSLAHYEKDILDNLGYLFT